MSVSSSFNSQSVADQIIYESDGSDQHWSPDTSAQSTQSAMTIQWPGVRQYENTSFNTSEAVYNVQNTGPVENPNYFNMQNNPALSNREYMDLSYQRRDCPVGNGYYVPNGNVMNTPNIGYNNNIMHTPRNGPVYTNQYQHAPRPNWNTNKVSNGGVKKPKRIRTAFTTQQMLELELEYARTRYLDRNRRIELSETLQLSEKTIKVWFQNRRMKDKKDRAEGVEDSEATSTTESSPEINVQIPQYNYHQNVHGGYNQGVYHERHSVPISTLHTSAMPVPVHNALVNSYPGYYTPNVTESNVANTVTLNQAPFQRAEIKQDEEEIVTSAFYTDQIECKEISVIENDGSCKEEASPQSDKVTKELQKASISGENWELSWVRIMNLQEEM